MGSESEKCAGGWGQSEKCARVWELWVMGYGLGNYFSNRVYGLGVTRAYGFGVN